MSQKFKVGDRVRRVKNDYRGMKIGDVSKIVSIDRAWIELEDYKGEHKMENFELVEKTLEELEILIPFWSVPIIEPLLMILPSIELTLRIDKPA